MKQSPIAEVPLAGTEEHTEPAPVIDATGDVRVADGAELRAPMRVRGRIHVGRQTRVVGSATSLAGADVGEGAIIEGQLTVAGPVHWGDRASASAAAIGGALITSGELVRATSVIATSGIHPSDLLAGRLREATA